MKKYLSAVLVALMMVSMASCGSNDNSSSNANSQIDSSDDAAVSEASSKAEESSKDSEDSEPAQTTVEAEETHSDPEMTETVDSEKRYLEFTKTKIDYPENFEKISDSYRTVKGITENGNTVYLSLFSTPSKEGLTYDGVFEDKKVQYWWIMDDAGIEGSEFAYECTADTVEDMEIEGYPFQRITGTFMMGSLKEQRPVKFVGCFGLMDYKTYGSGQDVDRPYMIIAYTESEDASAVDDLNSLIDYAVASFGWIE